MCARRRLAMLLTGGLLLLGLANPAASGAQMHREALPKEIEPLVARDFRDRGDGVLWEGKVSVPRTFYLRVRFARIVSPPGARYTIVIRGADERALARYPAEQFARSDTFYTGPLFADAVKIQVQGAAPLTGLSFTVDRVIHQVGAVGRITPQSVVPDWWSLNELRPATPALKVADAVAKLYIGEGFVCSGFLVATNAVLTNFHCLEQSASYRAMPTAQPRRCDDIDFQFDFDLQPSPANSLRVTCVHVLDADEPLDFALLSIPADQIARRGARRTVLPLATAGASSGEDVYVIHHPAGLAKKVSLGCQAFPTATNLLEHTCSTVGGSSGSPVIGQNGAVVGLHFAGAYPEDWTIKEINDALARGTVFRNRSRPIQLLRDRLRAFLP